MDWPEPCSACLTWPVKSHASWLVGLTKTLPRNVAPYYWCSHLLSITCIFLFLLSLILFIKGCLDCKTGPSNLSPSCHPSARLSTRRQTTSSCYTGATSTMPAVPISGLTAWSPNPRASYCPTCSEPRLLLPWQRAQGNQHCRGEAAVASRRTLRGLSPWAESENTEGP